MAWAAAGAGAEIVDKGGAEKEPEPKIDNFGSWKHWKRLSHVHLEDYLIIF